MAGGSDVPLRRQSRQPRTGGGNLSLTLPLWGGTQHAGALAAAFRCPRSPMCEAWRSCPPAASRRGCRPPLATPHRCSPRLRLRRRASSWAFLPSPGRRSSPWASCSSGEAQVQHPPEAAAPDHKVRSWGVAAYVIILLPPPPPS